MGEGCLSYEQVLKHYARPDVLAEIARFSSKRWVAVHCEERGRNGRPLLVRYETGDIPHRRPLTVDSPSDVERILSKLYPLRPRAFYASAALYRRIQSQEDLLDEGNVLAFTPTWDVDNRLEAWEATVETAKAILDFLEKEGISRSVFVKWSGRGAHVHLHQGAFSKELLDRHGPLNVAYAVVEYVSLKIGPKVADISAHHGAETLRVENKMDPQRVFTCPLSLHRELDAVAICISPDDLEDFTPEWIRPEAFRHWGGWDRFEPGEADELALRALEMVGGYPRPYRRRRRKTKRVEDMIMRFLKKNGEG